MGVKTFAALAVALPSSALARPGVEIGSARSARTVGGGGALSGRGQRAQRRRQAIEGGAAAGLYESIWQSFGVLLPVRSVGVMGDQRTFAETLCLRPVHSKYGMTADWVQILYKLLGELLGEISRGVVNEVRGINRVVYHITSKPPGTIEWE